MGRGSSWAEQRCLPAPRAQGEHPLHPHPQGTRPWGGVADLPAPWVGGNEDLRLGGQRSCLVRAWDSENTLHPLLCPGHLAPEWALGHSFSWGIEDGCKPTSRATADTPCAILGAGLVPAPGRGAGLDLREMGSPPVGLCWAAPHVTGHC